MRGETWHAETMDTDEEQRSTVAAGSRTGLAASHAEDDAAANAAENVTVGGVEVALRLKRAYVEPEESDGVRILVDRLWPRGRSKVWERLDSWEKTIAPSKDLRTWFGHDPEKFAEFGRRYRAELDANPDASVFVEGIAQRARQAAQDAKTDSGSESGAESVSEPGHRPVCLTVTLVFGAKDEQHNNAVVLLPWLRDRLAHESGSHAW